MPLALLSDEAITLLRQNNFSIGPEKENDVILLNADLPKHKIPQLIEFVATLFNISSEVLYSKNQSKTITYAKKVLMFLILHYFDSEVLRKHTKHIKGFHRLTIAYHIKNEPWIYDYEFSSYLIKACDALNIDDLIVRSYNPTQKFKVLHVININEIRRRL